MRRKDKEISNLDEKLEILAACKVCRLGLADGDTPYIVPLNYGYSFENGFLTLFFHGANNGKKIDILKKNNRACFEIDCAHNLIESDSACKFSFAFKSLIGSGRVVFLESPEEKAAALNKLMKHQTGKTFLYEESAFQKTAVYKLVVEEWTGKKKEPPENKNTLQFKEIKSEIELGILNGLINEIWPEVFIPVIGKEQVDYMLTHYQGKDVILKEINEGIKYFLIEYEGKPSGYFAYSIEENHLFISKIYFKKSLRGRGLLSIVFDYFEKIAVENKKSKLFLHVNRRNKKAVNIYINRGFEIVKIVNEPLGEKFFLNDYWMEYELVHK